MANKSYFNIWVAETVGTEIDPNILGATLTFYSTFKENLTCDGMDRTDKIAGEFFPKDEEDGIVIKKDEFYPNNAGRHSLTHETGHWLNLLHIFNKDPINTGCAYWTDCHPLSQSATNGDFIEDTNPQVEVNSFSPLVCASHEGECNGDIPVNYDNFMGYAHPCQNKFTQGQREWMFACLSLNRPYIWSDENLRCTGVFPETNNISVSTPWDFNTHPTGFVQVHNEIHIVNNATLTIASGITVQFCENAKLVVEPGCHLILNGKLTNTCFGKMWKGVEVQGSTTSNTQWPSNGIYTQGRLTASAGSIIENAVVGIHAGNSGGGIVICTGTTFLNNQRAVQFESFENHLPGVGSVTSNFSHFNTCDFITDSGYLGDNPAIYEPADKIKFYAFVDLSQVRGIRFLGCDFSNLRTDILTRFEYGIGILSSESGFIVSNFCSSSSPSPTPPCPAGNQVKCTFKNLYEGVFVGKTEIIGVLPKLYSIQSALFQGCWIGVRSEAASRGIIVQNTFKIGDVPFYDAPISIFGVLLESTHSTFTLQENNFERAQNILQDILDYTNLIGSRAYSIGETDNLIRKNYYTNLNIGNESVGDNATITGTGLLYLCNENQNNDFDFNVHDGIGVRSLQGILQGGPFPTMISAGNHFSHINQFESDFRSGLGVNGITYVHKVGSFPETPQTFTVNQVFPMPTPYDRQCESIYCAPPCRTENELNQEKQAILAAKVELNIVFNSYQQQPNGPNAAMQKLYMTALKSTIQANTFDVLLHIIANEGSLADYRYWLGNMDAYETDLELAKSYLGTGEYAQTINLLNTLPSKYGLNGAKLAEFNDYRYVLNIMQIHLESGGNKLNLPTSSINTLKNFAETNDYAQVRGFAKAMLLMYGIHYPPEEVVETSNRDAGSDAKLDSKGFNLAPNPADQSVRVICPSKVKQFDLIGQVSLYSIHGRLLSRQEMPVSENGLLVSLAGQPDGCYFIQVQLNNGESAMLPLLIAH